MKLEKKKQSVVLGLNAVGFNTSASLVIDGVVEFACEEERLIRSKRTRNFPAKGIQAALDFTGLSLNDVDAIAVSWNPGINMEAGVPGDNVKPRHIAEIMYSVPANLQKLLGVENSTYARSSLVYENRQIDVYYINHHLSHASCYFLSGFENAAILTVDAFGEKDCVTFNKGTQEGIETIYKQSFPHSLGAFYSAFTEFCGFRAQSDEWKLMGASPYGNPERYIDKLHQLFQLHDGAGFSLNLNYFDFYQFHTKHRFAKELVSHLELEPNRPGADLTMDYYDLCAGVQQCLEEIYFHLLNSLQNKTGLDNVVIAGGTALNSVANGKVLRNTGFSDIFVPPMPDDAGAGLGAALYTAKMLAPGTQFGSMTHNYLGPGFASEEIKQELEKYKIPFIKLGDPAKTAAELISEGAIIGWFQGRLEFGDRALGNRSILADPRNEEMKDLVNLTIKYRENFRPFAPAILQDKVGEYFEIDEPAPFMERVLPIRPEKRGLIPAVTHVDGSGRLQSVSREQNELFYDLIDCFYQLTKVPVVLNTSFNLKGEAMVCMPYDAIRTFYTSGLDHLIMGEYLLSKQTK